MTYNPESILKCLAGEIKTLNEIFKDIRCDCKFYKYDENWGEMKCFHTSEGLPSLCHPFLCPLTFDE